MHKKLIALAALALSACVTTPDGERHVDRRRICETSLRVTNTVAGIASVLENNGFAPNTARTVAEAALASGDVIGFTCAAIIAKSGL